MKFKKDKKPLDKVVVIKEVHDFNLAGSCEKKCLKMSKLLKKKQNILPTILKRKQLRPLKRRDCYQKEKLLLRFVKKTLEADQPRRLPRAGAGRGPV